VHGEAGEYLGRRDELFDLIVLDPPPFARSRADSRRAEHLYVELNALALRALNPGGFLMTFSCSSHFCGEDFVRAMRIAEGRSGRRMRLLARLGPGPDHPLLLGHPEGEYLTGVLLRDLG
jgi:23S rRNA (cytosine1962-C5)-methyltransferase